MLKYNAVGNMNFVLQFRNGNLLFPPHFSSLSPSAVTLCYIFFLSFLLRRRRRRRTKNEGEATSANISHLFTFSTVLGIVHM